MEFRLIINNPDDAREVSKRVVKFKETGLSYQEAFRKACEEYKKSCKEQKSRTQSS